MILIFSQSNNWTIYGITFAGFAASGLYLQYTVGSVGFKALLKFLDSSTNVNENNNSSKGNNFCSNCGNKINQDDKFCGKCGKQLK